MALDMEEEEESTPCLACSFRGSRRHHFQSLILPTAARYSTTWSASVGVAHPHRPGRGRAQLLRHRRKHQERRAPGGSDQQDDARSSSSGDTGSCYSNGKMVLNIPTHPWSEQTETNAPSVDASNNSVNVFTPLLMPEPAMLHQTDEDPEEKESNISRNVKHGKKKSKKKFVPLDFGQLPVEEPCQLLYGVPAGAETYGNSYSRFQLAGEETYTPEFGYVLQRQPQVNSVLDFPMLPQDNASTQKVPSMNVVPRKPSNSMKAIASLVVRDDDSVDPGESNGSDGDEGDDDSVGGATLVLENVPRVISKGTVRDFLETYGAVASIRTEKIGDSCTMYAKMGDETAQWAAESLDGSDTLIPNGEEGEPLHVYVML